MPLRARVLLLSAAAAAVAALFLLVGRRAGEVDGPPAPSPRTGTAGAPAAPGDAPAAGGRLPNIVLLVVDTLRADHLGTYGYGRDTSPHIDRLAAGSLVFEQCHSHSSETRPSMAALLSGFLPHETRITELPVLPDAVVVLPERLSALGYRTGAVVSNYVLHAGRGFEQGFDLYDDRMDDRELGRDWPERIAGRTTDAALAMLDELGDGPFFLWVHYQDPHGPYTPPPEFADLFHDPDAPPEPLPVNETLSGFGGIPRYQRLGEHRDRQHYVDRYDGEIRYLDEQLGRLLAGLRARGLYDDALLLLTADHGEALGEHGQYFAHMEHLCTPLTRVPLVVRHGERFSGRRDDPVQHVDLVPTILARVGAPADPRLRGRDLLAPPREPPAIVAEVGRLDVPGGVRRSLLSGGFRLVHSLPEDTCELFDLAADPDEQHDLSGDPAHRARLATLRRQLADLHASDRLEVDIRRQAESLFSEEELQKLEALGYLR